MSLSKYLLIGVGATAIGAGVLWLSRETDSAKFDSKVHTLEKLHKILEETYLEYACSYIFYYNMILNIKDAGQFKPEMLDGIKSRVLEYTKVRDEQICKRAGITPSFLEAWIRKYSTDAKVQQVFRDIEDLHEQAIIKHNIREMHFEIPETLTREKYVQIARKVQACSRHEAYNRIQDILKKEGKDKITNDEMDELLETIGNERQEKFRIEAMRLYGVEVPEGEVPKHFLQKAYLKFSTVSAIKTKPGEPVVRSRWNEQIQQDQKQHGELLTKIQNGERIEGIEKDPLASSETDIVIDYSALPGFLQREKSQISGQDKLRIQPHSGGLKQVEKLLKRVKAHHHEEPIAEKVEGEEGDAHHEDEEEEKKQASEEPAAEEGEKETVEVVPVTVVSQEVVEEKKEEVIEAPVEATEIIAAAEEAKVEEADTAALPYVTDRAQLVGCEEPKIAQKKSYKVELVQGQTYYYCTCGRSANQPFCDGAHSQEGCTYKPLQFTHEQETGTFGLCGCKHNAVEKGPYCDGSHKSLPEKLDW